LALGSVVILNASASAAPIKVVDDVGTTMVVQSGPKRVVCLSPGAVEIIFALGEGRRLVAVCGLCNFPPETGKLPKVGDFLSVSAESVMAVRPDLVVATGGVQKELVLRLRALDVPVIVLYPHSLAGVSANMVLLGRILGVEKGGLELARRFESRCFAITSRAKRKASGPKPRVYFEVSPDPLVAASDRGYVGDLINWAGGSNIVTNVAEEYPRMSTEFVISRDPEVIILSHTSNPSQALQELRARPGWDKVSAVRNGRVYADINMDLVMRPGPRLASGLGLLHQRIYP